MHGVGQNKVQQINLTVLSVVAVKLINTLHITALSHLIACSTLGNTTSCFATTSTSCQISVGRRRGRGMCDCHSRLLSDSHDGMEERSLQSALHSHLCHLHHPQLTLLLTTHSSTDNQRPGILQEKLCTNTTAALLQSKLTQTHLLF